MTEQTGTVNLSFSSIMPSSADWLNFAISTLSLQPPGRQAGLGSNGPIICTEKSFGFAGSLQSCYLLSLDCLIYCAS